MQSPSRICTRTTVTVGRSADKTRPLAGEPIPRWSTRQSQAPYNEAHWLEMREMTRQWSPVGGHRTDEDTGSSPGPAKT